MKRFLCLSTAAITLSSCFHVYYAPNTVNAPLLSEKGEVRFNALYSNGANSDYDGGEFQFACAVTDKWAIICDYFAAGKEENTGSYVEKGHGSYGEIGAGIFKTVDPKAKCIFEVYGGIGGGHVSNEYGLGDESNVGIAKFFIQPDIGYKGKYFEALFCPRLAIVNWKVKDSYIKHTEHQYEQENIDYIKSNRSNFAFEPAFVIRAGSEQVKAQLALTFSNFHGSTIYFNEFTETLNGSLGITFNIKSRKKPGQ
jgi:hypothetical protein